MTAMIHAMRVLTDPANTGAVTIALPQDVQAEVYDYPAYFFQKRVHRIERRVPSAADLKDAVERIKGKKKPLIICGGGVRYAEAADSLRRFAEKFNIPYAETQAGKSAIESSHDYNLGGIGVTGNLSANLIAKDTDLVIGVGTRYSDFTTGSKRLFLNPEVDFLTINVSEYQGYKLDAVKLVADAKLALDALEGELEKMGYRSGYIGEIESARDAWKTELNRLHHTCFEAEGFISEFPGQLDEVLPEFKELFESSLTQTRVIGQVNKLIDEDAIIIGAAGSLPGDLHRMWENRRPNTYHLEYGYSCMGYEVSGALGIKMAEPEKEVYAMVGDGSYLMLHSELVTSLQERKKINVLLFDNATFGCINNLQMNNGMNSFGTEFRYRNPETGRLDGELIKIDFAQSAAGYGVKTYRVHTLEELEEAIADAKKQTVSTLIDIKVLPKTMCNDYEQWWHVAVAGVSNNPKVQQAYMRKEESLKQARQY